MSPDRLRLRVEAASRRSAGGDALGRCVTCRRGGLRYVAGSSIVQRALDTRWLTERGVPSIRQQWIEMHYGKQNGKFNPAAVNLTGTAGCGPRMSGLSRRSLGEDGWCGRREVNPPADPIGRSFHA